MFLFNMVFLELVLSFERKAICLSIILNVLALILILTFRILKWETLSHLASIIFNFDVPDLIWEKNTSQSMLIDCALLSSLTKDKITSAILYELLEAGFNDVSLGKVYI